MNFHGFEIINIKNIEKDDMVIINHNFNVNDLNNNKNEKINNKNNKKQIKMKIIKKEKRYMMKMMKMNYLILYQLKNALPRELQFQN